MNTMRNLTIINGSHALAVKVSSMLKPLNTSVFKNTCAKCKGKVGRQDVCRGECDCVVSGDEIVSGFKTIDKTGNEKILTYTKAEVNALHSGIESIEVIGSIPLDQIDVRRLTDGYYLLPRKVEVDKKNSPTTTEPYVYMAEGLEQSGKAFQIKYTIGKYERLGLIISQNGILILKNYVFNEQLVECDEELDVKKNAEAVKKFKKGIEALKTVDFNTFKNQYNKAVEDLIAGKKPKIVKPKQVSGMDFFD
jgi:non-homologous end joining protein Ku